MLKILNICSAPSMRWFRSEYFYSFIDKPFFQENELVETTSEAGLPVELNKKEWSIVRQSFAHNGRPQEKRAKGSRPRRLFSEQFIADEKRKLQRYREIFREIMAQYTKQGVYLNTVNGELSEFKLDS